MTEKTLLYIDDREMNRKSFKWSLDSFADDQKLGEIVLAPTGEEGLRLITNDTHIVVSDFDLGTGMDGIAVLKWVQENRPDIYRVLHSAHLSSSEFSEKAQSECSPHILLPKPFSSDKFVQEMHELLAHGDATQLPQ
ncbi:MAG: response regulator [Candidatus Peribacter sp.]|nr:response regulator [Candidatus Peribacter sp.]MBT4393128.1 response regulator [Candidatus Peribacter sp.]MBT4600927.1 response regulator [Candidatus Peribacter sp.]MBT5148943.1 response regulator [Candidatus Peribacter sp.]MBT5638378.1 response regulator [Candidatus Peribacter sp.]